MDKLIASILRGLCWVPLILILLILISPSANEWFDEWDRYKEETKPFKETDYCEWSANPDYCIVDYRISDWEQGEYLRVWTGTRRSRRELRQIARNEADMHPTIYITTGRKDSNDDAYAIVRNGRIYYYE